MVGNDSNLALTICKLKVNRIIFLVLPSQTEQKLNFPKETLFEDLKLVATTCKTRMIIVFLSSALLATFSVNYNMLEV